jgi:hypothetical protein
MPTAFERRWEKLSRGRAPAVDSRAWMMIEARRLPSLTRPPRRNERRAASARSAPSAHQARQEGAVRNRRGGADQADVPVGAHIHVIPSPA